jgi:hypothetical protein
MMGESAGVVSRSVSIMACKICETRRARRFCPAAGGDICAVCCGTGREETILCPLDCEYLRQARGREKRAELNPEQIPNADIPITDEFLHENAPLLGAAMLAVMQAGLGTPGAVDRDVREALESMVRTYRTRESGLYYESRPDNLVAAKIQEEAQRAIAAYIEDVRGEYGVATMRDTDVFGVLVFLQRTALYTDNGRSHGRAFLDFLRANTEGVQPQPSGASSLLLP